MTKYLFWFYLELTFVVYLCSKKHWKSSRLITFSLCLFLLLFFRHNNGEKCGFRFRVRVRSLVFFLSHWLHHVQHKIGIHDFIQEVTVIFKDCRTNRPMLLFKDVTINITCFIKRSIIIYLPLKCLESITDC